MRRLDGCAPRVDGAEGRARVRRRRGPRGRRLAPGRREPLLGARVCVGAAPGLAAGRADQQRAPGMRGARGGVGAAGASDRGRACCSCLGTGTGAEGARGPAFAGHWGWFDGVLVRQIWWVNFLGVDFLVMARLDDVRQEWVCRNYLFKMSAFGV